jgi:hypothetical protein
MLSPFTGQMLTTLIWLGEHTGPARAQQAHRVWPGHTGHRPDLPAKPDPTAIQYMRDDHAEGKVVINL